MTVGDSAAFHDGTIRDKTIVFGVFDGVVERSVLRFVMGFHGATVSLSRFAEKRHMLPPGIH